MDNKQNKKNCKKSSKSSRSSSDSSRLFSDSDSLSDVMEQLKECVNKNNKKNKHNVCKKKNKSKNSSCSSVSSHHDKKKKKKHNDSDSDCNKSMNKLKKCDMDLTNLYNYFRCKLYHDKELMIAGADVMACSISKSYKVISPNYPLDLDHDDILYNVKHYDVNAPFIVKKDGVYVVFIALSTDQSCQFTIFVNGDVVPLTCIGNNSGAGQLISRHLLKLYENDTVLVRNYQSTNPVELPEYVGGSQQTVNCSFLLHKISPIPKYMECDEYNDKCLSEKKLCIFKKLKQMLVNDPILMLNGFNTTGSFFNYDHQTVLPENSFVFSNHSNVNNMTFINNTNNVVINEDGIYKIFFLVATTTAAQIAFFVNDVCLNETINGTNKGAGQLTIRKLVSLKKGDVFTVRNHTSGNSIHTSPNGGGQLNGVNLILTIYKASPTLDKLMLLNEYEKCENYLNYDCHKYQKMYCDFKEYLLHKKYLNLTGSNNYISSYGSTKDILTLGESLRFNTDYIKHDMKHINGEYEFIIENDGLYDIFADIITDQPAQFTLFINDIEDNTTTIGRDSGGNRTLVRQLIEFKKHDVLTLRNWKSSQNPIMTSVNPGGNYISQSYSIMLYQLFNKHY
jgi:hypothetical protein